MTLFHFDLRHLDTTDGLEVEVLGAASFELRGHDDATRSNAVSANPALAALPDSAREAFTHYADVPDEEFATPAVRFVRVIEPAPPGVHLAEVKLMAVHLPEGHLRAFYAKQLQLAKQPVERLRAFHRASLVDRPRLHSAKLASLGMTALPDDPEEAIGTLVAAQNLVTTLDTAGALVSHHPELANIQGYTATIILNDHILPDPEVDPDQYNAMQVLSQAIAASPSWSPVVRCTDKTGAPMSAGYDLTDAQGGFTTGQPLYTYTLDPNVDAAAQPCTGGARKTALDDMRLSGKTWAPTPGTSVIDQPAPDPRAFATTALGDVSYKWTVTERTDHHGVGVDPRSIVVDDKGTFSIDASNQYLRTLYTGYQLIDDKERPIGDKQLLYSISATNTIMGIPTWTDPTPLRLPLGKASGVQLYFGSLGTTDWDPDVSWRGALLTGLWQYGVPTVLLIAGTAFTDSKLFNKIVNDPDLLASTLAVGFGVVGGGVATASALTNTKKILTACADAVLTLVVQKGLEKLGQWLLTKVGSGAISSAFGPVGWVLKLAAAGLNFEEMMVTTGQVLSSPACITVTAKRAIDVTLTLHPDPAHGEAGRPETAVWPAVATKYVATLEYRDGTSIRLQDDLPTTTSNAPIPLKFSDVPAGGDFRIFTGVYSKNGWLAGSWQSDWRTATPTSGTTLPLGDQKITENLVPLAADTQYVFKERVVTDGHAFTWVAGGLPPATPVTSLACGSGGTLCELVGMSINNSAFQIGYAWRASGQGLSPDNPSAPVSDAQLYAVQNLSVLAQPGSQLKRSGIGLTDRPAIAYTPVTNSNVIDQTNFVVDPRGGNMNLRKVTLNDQRTTFGLEDPGLMSWGSLPMENVDAAAIHSSSTVVACSWQTQKLMLLSLPSAPSPDGQAPTALMVSGEGLRQGLLQGPRALATAPDGRILVLETVNRRVQAFDTKGNGVPSFTPRPSLLMLDTAAIADELTSGSVPEVIQAAWAAAGLTTSGSLDRSFSAQLDTGAFKPANDPLIQALSEQGVDLAYDPDNMTDPTSSAQIKVVDAGSAWTITDPRGFAWGISATDGTLVINRRLTKVQITTEKTGEQWLIVDQTALDAWRLTASSGTPGKTEVRACLTYFPLQPARVGTITYLDMAVEAQGYVYVLSYRDDGSKPEHYILDIYAPDGTFVVRTPDPSVTPSPQNVVAGRIAIDIWRNLYALTYETMHGPGPQPGVAHWTPTPPLFTLSLSTQPDFNQRNIAAVIRDFASQGVRLSNQALIEVVDADGAWTVKDGAAVYHIYRSGDGLQVYAIPA
ncbi:hypothetical protein [Yinghuangia seranimata]|uniref:hypothetical protein n=1 Tax=Yinghuangia seranimata TaxID=408067 RepID=UPI00248A9891|nr:hypothetical protein [Yinghuangia seranimata]MDI2124981.1 hypothetical protein [Yinghuangia seranimata]